MENEILKENISKTNLKLTTNDKTFKKAYERASDALRKSNYNEQYSRKNNIKVHGVKEVKGEKVLEAVNKVLQDAKLELEIKEENVVAIHRIPGRKDQERPILIKMKNNSCKATVMRKRSDLKKATGGYKFVDDVTKLNTELIGELLKHPDIQSAWYFNGSIYGQKKDSEKRIKFDLFDDIGRKLKEVPDPGK